MENVDAIEAYAQWVLNRWDSASRAECLILVEAMCRLPSLSWQAQINCAQQGGLLNADLLLARQDEIYLQIANGTIRPT